MININEHWKNHPDFQYLFWGIVVLIGTFLCMFVLMFFWGGNAALKYSILILCGGLHLSCYCFRKYQSFSTEKADTIDVKDKPYILYLRSFNDDSETDDPFISVGQFYTEEEILVTSLEDVGMAVAIGIPGEQAPPLGAKRIYVSDNKWQDKVQELSGDARLIVFRFGITKGLRWEWDHCLNKITDISKLLLIVPVSIASDQENIDSLVAKIKKHRENIICERIDGSQTLNIGSIGLILYFEKTDDNKYLLKQIHKLKDWNQSKLKRVYYWKAFWNIRPEKGEHYLAFDVEEDANGRNALKYYLEPILSRFDITIENENEAKWSFRFIQVTVYFIVIALAYLVVVIIAGRLGYKL